MRLNRGRTSHTDKRATYTDLTLRYPMNELEIIRQEIRKTTHKNEYECVHDLLHANTLSKASNTELLKNATSLVIQSRKRHDHKDILDDFLIEFGLSNKEGIALMCLAESLLRIPDAHTADKLIAEKISLGNWQQHLGHSSSIFVNASTWGLILTGKIIREEAWHKDNSWLNNMLTRMGEPLVRKAMLQAMKILGSHYVLGRTITEAMKRGKKENTPDTLFSFDMLGEGARTKNDADHYFSQYLQAIDSIGQAQSKTSQPHAPIENAPSISVKISALHPRYEYSQEQRIITELRPKLFELAMQAKKYNIGFTIDAEEARRLDISLNLFESLACDPQLADWNGLGFVLQAYQKRAPLVAKWLISLAKLSKRIIMVRLVKGAYWDSEIKYAQEQGFDDYPVYTRKANTDLSYQICAHILLSDQKSIYPQFATHNAHTIAMVAEMGSGKNFEYQRLHGMGRLLYQTINQPSHDDSMHSTKCPTPHQETESLNSLFHTKRPIRIYAPVGAHKDLLPYLVRRLLENGANSSFVNRFLDKDTPVTELISDIVLSVQSSTGYRHTQIPLPKDIYLNDEIKRTNSNGVDLNNPNIALAISQKIMELRQQPYNGGSIIKGVTITDDMQTTQGDACNNNNSDKNNHKQNNALAIYSPSDKNLIGYSHNCTDKYIEDAFTSAQSSQQTWNAIPADERANIIENLAKIIQSERDELLSLIVHEAGRTISDAINEIREAIEFCLYYAQLARKNFGMPKNLSSPTGEHNSLWLEGRGIFICISPWNFPLAIFTGQVVAALAAGNAVLAKPAEQTPLIAHKIVSLMHQAGIDNKVLHLITGGAHTGETLINDKRVAGVVFTGSTSVAKLIQINLAQNHAPIVPLIAETGGQNAMIVDSSALLEQVCDDMIMSAFLSAGQRCSSARVLFVQSDIADTLMTMISHACDELHVAPSWNISCDIGPVIDKEALNTLHEHIYHMQKNAKTIYQYPQKKLPHEGHFIGPHIFEIDHINSLKKEVFGPVLHIIRWQAQDLDKVIDQINDSQFGLTLGIHTRIESRAQHIFKKVNVGNTYVNRNMVGAIVGVNPFGGQGLSGTGPKAGGPHYLHRFANEKTLTVNTVATGGNADLLSISND